MKRFQHFIEYYSLRGFAAFVRLLPLSAARWIARRMADLVFFLIPLRKKVVIANLTAAFGATATPPEIRRIAHRTYRQFAQTMIELLFFPRIGNEKLSSMVRLANPELLDRALSAGRGAVLVGSHYGNWELMAAAIAQRYPLSLVIGQQKNSKVDDLLNSYRLAKGTELIPLKMALRGALKALKHNRFIAIIADQDAHEDGAFVDFFGRPSSTSRGPAVFALRAGCPLITGHIVRAPDGTFTVTFEEIPRPSSGDEERDVHDYTAAFTKCIERNCRKHPDHWFWMHRRWKTAPPHNIL